MNAAAVPKATVNENGQTLPPKDEIRFSRYKLVTAPALDAVCPKNGNQAQFGVFVAFRPHCGHYLGTLLFRKDIAHQASPKPAVVIGEFRSMQEACWHTTSG